MEPRNPPAPTTEGIEIDPRELLSPAGAPLVPPGAEDAPEQPWPREEPPGGCNVLEAEFQKVFGAVQRALQMASYLPVDEGGITRVAVVSRRGQLIASAALEGTSQARFLLDQLHPLGFEEQRSTAATKELGCDLLVVHAADLEYGQAQGIVRGLHPERWPPEAPVPRPEILGDAQGRPTRKPSKPPWPARRRGRS